MMYLELFKLHELPSGLSPTPQFLVLEQAHARARRNESTIGSRTLRGDHREIGAGKTTSDRGPSFREFSRRGSWADQPTQLAHRGSFRTVLVQFGSRPPDEEAGSAATLNQFPEVDQYNAGPRSCHRRRGGRNLSYRVLEEIRHALPAS